MDIIYVSLQPQNQDDNDATMDSDQPAPSSKQELILQELNCLLADSQVGL